ncbi:hypothetical protein F5X97DRAFT_214489 [Nemania serpens]|nr:hypothetical protein F5X97DRAFT_214489 [Nemania serpens]
MTCVVLNTTILLLVFQRYIWPWGCLKQRYLITSLFPSFMTNTRYAYRKRGYQQRIPVARKGSGLGVASTGGGYWPAVHFGRSYPSHCIDTLICGLSVYLPTFTRLSTRVYLHLQNTTVAGSRNSYKRNKTNSACLPRLDSRKKHYTCTIYSDLLMSRNRSTIDSTIDNHSPYCVISMFSYDKSLGFREEFAL